MCVSTTVTRTPRPDAAASADLTGRDRLPWNVLCSWAGHAVFIVFGFLVPRMIDGRLGREALGVWDFGWSLVSYFALVQAGVVSSVNRYVSRYRATANYESINCAVSSVTAVLVAMAGVVVGLTVVATIAVPRLMAEQLGEHTGEAAWVVCFLGVSLATQVGSAAYGGVLTGYHRWDLHNGIRAGAHALAAISMIIILLVGGGLWALALAVLAGEVIGRLVSCWFAHRVCASLKVRLSFARWGQAREMLAFGGKGFLAYAGELLVGSTVGVLIVCHLGPAALALYARPLALVRHGRTLVQKFAFVLTPTASSLQAMDKLNEVRRLVVDATRYGAYIALPMVVTLAILGGPILYLWMGPDYQRPWIVAILALGYFSVMLQRPVVSILSGLNKHGRPGVANLAAALAGISGAAVALGVLDASLEAVALAVVLPVALVNGIYVPLYACACVRLHPVVYIGRALRGPVLCAVPFGLCLATAVAACPESPSSALVLGAPTGLVVLAVLYWRYVLGHTLKRRIITAMRFRRTRLADNVA